MIPANCVRWNLSWFQSVTVRWTSIASREKKYADRFMLLHACSLGQASFVVGPWFHAKCTSFLVSCKYWPTKHFCVIFYFEAVHLCKVNWLKLLRPHSLTNMFHRVRSFTYCNLYSVRFSRIISFVSGSFCKLHRLFWVTRLKVRSIIISIFR